MLPPAETDLFRGRLIVRESTKAAAGKGPARASGPAGKRGKIGEEISLFDGKTLKGWHAVPRVTAPRWPSEPMPVLDAATTRADPRPFRPLDGGGRRDLRPPGSARQRARRLSGQRRDLRRLRARLRGAPRLAGRYRHHAARDADRLAGLPGAARPPQVRQHRRLLRQRHRPVPRDQLQPRRRARRGRPSDRAEAGGSGDHASSRSPR